MAYEFSVLISTFGVERSTLKKYIVASILSADRQASIKTGEKNSSPYFVLRLPAAGRYLVHCTFSFDILRSAFNIEKVFSYFLKQEL